jgi:hypothetical protein
MPRKSAVHVCPNRFTAEGARGGCIFEIEPSERKDFARLGVGWSCVMVHDGDIPITWLSEVVAIATAHEGGIAGFLKHHNYGGGYALVCDPVEATHAA